MGIDGSEKTVEVESTGGGDMHVIRSVLEGEARLVIKKINLVKDVNLGLIEGVEFAQDGLDLRHLLGGGGTGGVGYLEQDSGALHLFKRGAEGGDERRGKVADEAYCVRQQHISARRQSDGAKSGIEGGKHARAFDHSSAGERVEQSGLAGIGVADEGDDRNRNAFAALALLRADAAHILDLLFDVLDAAMDFAAIGFELRFAGASGADAAAKLGHLRTSSAEAGEHVFELSKLDLELTFTGSGVAGKDIKNELGAIDDAAVELAFEIAKLGRGEFVVEDQDASIGHFGGGGDLFNFAAPDERGRIGTVAALQYLADYDGTCALGGRGKIGERKHGGERKGVIL